MLPTKSIVNWPFGSGEEAKNRFSRWRPLQPNGGHLGFPIRMIIAIFDLPVTPVTPMLPTKFQVIGLWVHEKKRKIDFQDGGHGGHLGCPKEMPLTIFYLHVTPILPTQFRAIWPFSSGEEVKDTFSRWTRWRPSWISDRNNFSYI